MKSILRNGGKNTFKNLVSIEKAGGGKELSIEEKIKTPGTSEGFPLVEHSGLEPLTSTLPV
jgi:hypothetical protein